jgi:hypothetical protein
MFVKFVELHAHSVMFVVIVVMVRIVMFVMFAMLARRLTLGVTPNGAQWAGVGTGGGCGNVPSQGER